MPPISKKKLFAIVWVAVKVVVLIHLFVQWSSKSPTETVTPTGPVPSPQSNTAIERPKPYKIPGIIHQSWKTNKIPKEFTQWFNAWSQLNPTYEHKLWTDQDNYDLIAEHYPWFLPTYESYKRPIMKADAVRVFYLHRYGGVYADLDVIPLKPMDELLGNNDLVLAKMDVPPMVASNPDSNWYYVNQIPNAWMASKPGHPFWMHAAKLMMTLAEEKREMSVEEMTGPIVIYRSFYEYDALRKEKKDELDPVTLVEPYAIFPYSWTPISPDDLHSICSQQSPKFNQVECLKQVDPENKSYAISYWSHTWDKKRSRYFFWRLFGY